MKRNQKSQFSARRFVATDAMIVKFQNDRIMFTFFVRMTFESFKAPHTCKYQTFESVKTPFTSIKSKQSKKQAANGIRII